MSLPTGTLTFLFTDIEGSTRLLETLGHRYGETLDSHRQLLRDAIEAHGGQVVDMDGDASFATFSSSREAVLAAAQAQRALTNYKWISGLPVRVRMGLHSGEAAIAGHGYVGLDVHRGARIMSAGHGGQVLLSDATRHLLGNEIDGLALRDLGEHRLKDLTALRLYQLLIPGLQAEFPALKTLDNRTTNLPIQPTPLVGRQRELRQAAEILARSDVRLLTLTGVGGTGKTRLALQLAADQLDLFPDGVSFVDLSTVNDPDLALPTIAQVLGLSAIGGRSSNEALSEYLHDRRALLLLDNFEQIVAGAGGVAALIRSAPGPKFLVTSRMPLRISAEHEYRVPPLGLPARSEWLDLGALSATESVALFVERARAIRNDFTLTSENAPAVAEICIRLDGLPLAIELAAARIRALSAPALLVQLNDRLKVLTGGMRDMPARQQTLRATIDWSYDLLEPAEQRLLRRLAVFEGGFDLDAVQGVCSFDDDLGAELMDGLASLVEKSLVQEQDQVDAETSYSMLETIHAYAREKLGQTDEISETRRRHAEHYLALAEQTERFVYGEEPPATGFEERMAKEVPNFRAALEWAFEGAEPEFALRLAAAARWAWYLSSENDLERWLTRAVDRTAGLNTVDRGRALLALADIESAKGDVAASRIIYESALDVLQRTTAGKWEVRVMAHLAELEARAGDLQRARSLSAQAHALADELGERARWPALQADAHIEDWAGNHGKALTLFEELAALGRRIGVPPGAVAQQLLSIGWVAMEMGDFTRARASLESFLDEPVFRTPSGLATAHGNLGLLALCEGEPIAAGAHIGQSLKYGADRNHAGLIIEGLHAVAAIASAQENAHIGLQLWSAAELIREGIGASLSVPEQIIFERYVEPAVGELTDEARAGATREGREMSRKQAVDVALEAIDRVSEIGKDA